MKLESSPLLFLAKGSERIWSIPLIFLVSSGEAFLQVKFEFPQRQFGWEGGVEGVELGVGY